MNEPTSEPATRRARLVVAYDGAGFHGFAPNEGVATVAETLREALGRVAREPVDLVGAGRTDAGVHAWGQVVSCDLPTGVDLDGLVRRLNSMCGPAIVVRSAEWADPGFDARFSARWRRYRYTVLNSPVPDPFLARTAWHVPRPLSLASMRLGCDPLIGEHDFSAFCRRPKVAADGPPPSMVRRVLDADWHVMGSEHPGPLLVFEIRATAFCHQMVRSIVGTLVDVGLGRLHGGDVRGILLGRDRSRAGQVAPPHGLCLWDVGYGATGP
jgi:tRNA pseudouridine38-40 synthase